MTHPGKLEHQFEDHIIDFHLAQDNWDCGCDASKTLEQMCSDSQQYAWDQTWDWFFKSIPTPTFAEPALAMAA